MDLELLRAEFPDGTWCLDTEFATPPGKPVIPVCLVAHELFSGQCIRQFFEPGRIYSNSLPVGERALFVAFAAHAEWGCFLSLGWQLPIHVLDLYAEFRNEISGRTPPQRRESFDTRLMGAMDYCGLGRISAVEKKEMQQRISFGHPFTPEEREEILLYCESDVVCLEKLLPALASSIELEFAIFRGRYSKAVARIERVGIPVDRKSYEQLIQNREALKSKLIMDFEQKHGPSPYKLGRHGIHRFSFRQLEIYLDNLGVLSAWLKTPKARLKTREDYFQFMANKHPVLRPLAELVKRIGDLRQFGLTIGPDNRARYAVMPFASETGRNQPKARQFLFAQSSWTRGFVKPAEGQFVAYLDWTAAEFAIAAVLSQDHEMLKAYASGDPYLQSAVAMRFAPKDATKATHGSVRDLFKSFLLSTQYGALATTLVNKLTPELTAKMPYPLEYAEEFLSKHHQVYWRYWQWALARVEIFINETRCEQTCFGWRHHLNRRLKTWKIRNESLNFPVQATGAEILRWACVFATEAGIDVCAPVHDALLVCGPIDRLEEIVVQTKICMDRASDSVLGLTMQTDIKIVRYPDRFMDPRGMETWKSVMDML